MSYKILRSFLEKFDLCLTRKSGDLMAYVPQITQRIGAGGALEVFAHYISNYELLCGDEELTRFMHFYVQNYRLSSSQWSQDIFVMYSTHMKKGGYYLEIGGADGYTHSNTYSLEMNLGWQGTLVEPDPAQYKILSLIRNGNRLINSAISPSGEEGFVRLRQVGQLSSLEGYEGDDIHRETRLGSRDFASVKSVNLNKILSEKKYDYFSLDVEGAELEILNSVQWNQVHKPLIMTVEYNFREEDRVRIVGLLGEYGYVENFVNHDWLRRGDLWLKLLDY